MQITELSQEYFDQVIALGNLVHGDNYLTPQSMQRIYHKGLSQSINTSFIAVEKGKVIGFRLTYAAGNWALDPWCSAALWPFAHQDICYFKSATIAPDRQGEGIGGRLLAASIDANIRAGAKAGLAHIWMQSPGNAAFKYFSKAGGELVKVHKDRWLQDCIDDGYVCTRCGERCHCDAGEMLLAFENSNARGNT